MNCPEGKKLRFKDFCYEQGQCPISTKNMMAITSNCSKLKDQHCPSKYYMTKVCIDRVDHRNITDYCYQGTACPKANEGLEFDQCVSPNELQSSAMTFVSRTDPNKNIFVKQYYHNTIKRRNYYPLLELKNGTLSCQNETYFLDDLCYANEINRPCTLPGTHEIDDLDSS